MNIKIKNDHEFYVSLLTVLNTEHTTIAKYNNW